MSETLDEYLELRQEIAEGRSKYVNVIFRRLEREVPSTTYATHGLYGYPAKFIPHVVRFVLKKYTNKGDWVFDPFAGYGTVAIECSLMGRNYIVWDLNPMLTIFVKAATSTYVPSPEEIAVDWDYQGFFKPYWSHLEYWHPKEFLDVLCRGWRYYHHQISDELKPIAAIPLLKVTKYFSYADLQVAKLYKSKKAKERVKNLLKSDWKLELKRLYNEKVKEVIRKIREYNELKPKPVEGIIRAGIDSLKEELNEEVDIILTSPPYLQAQEYIRSFKLELFWLGFTEHEVRRLQKAEIPYNYPPHIEIKSKTYEQYKEKVRRLGHKKLLEIYEAYFGSLAYFFERVYDKVRKYICIFVGPVKIRNIKIPIDEILKEILESMGWAHEKTYIDTVVSRRLFETKINPATGLPDERMQTEHLLVMRRSH